MSNVKASTIPMVLLAVLLGLAIPASHASAQSDSESQVYSLARALQVALVNSETIRDAEMELEIAKQQVREAYGRVLPDVSLPRVGVGW